MFGSLCLRVVTRRGDFGNMKKLKLSSTQVSSIQLYRIVISTSIINSGQWPSSEDLERIRPTKNIATKGLFSALYDKYNAF